MYTTCNDEDYAVEPPRAIQDVSVYGKKLIGEEEIALPVAS